MIVFHLFFIKLLIGTVLHLTAPRTLFPEACSTLLYSSDGQLLGARIAPDGQCVSLRQTVFPASS